MAIIRAFAGLVVMAGLWLGVAPGAGPGAGMTQFGAVGGAEAAELTEEIRDLAPFNRIDVRGNFELHITVSAAQSVRVETAPRDLKRLGTEVRGDTLFLSFQERWFSFLFNNQRIVTISLPALQGMAFAGAGEIKVAGIDSEAFDLRVSGASDISLKGRCGSADFQINGAGDLNAEDFKCQNVSIEINGAGDAEVYASASVEAVINGVGNIDVYGDPEGVEKKINGFGEFQIVE